MNLKHHLFSTEWSMFCYRNDIDGGSVWYLVTKGSEGVTVVTATGFRCVSKPINPSGFCSKSMYATRKNPTGRLVDSWEGIGQCILTGGLVIRNCNHLYFG